MEDRGFFHYVVIAALAFCFGTFLTYQIIKEQSMPLVHKLQAPLLFNGSGAENHQYILPAGTSLYFDQAFPEGFVRYKVYFNVEGVRLDSQEATDKFWLDPLTAFPPDQGEVKKLLTGYPLGKSELAAILKSSYLTKDEIRELLLEYSK
ncbi:hypothetical protein [Azonexus hydrophilus]|uniref:hypothetical protein n=1 Tax=Azonexus hydrophilus TaxID=418702 RepID=UPI00197AAD99|nr:hypothetical protein [Azonexus hydrophilus]